MQTTVNKEIREIKASSQRVGVKKNTNEVRNFHFLIDEPVKLGGTNKAPTPMEFVLGSFNGCILIVIETIAKEIGFPFNDLKSESVGTVDRRGIQGTADVSPHFGSVTNTIWFDTTESEERIQALQELVKKRCPVYNLFRDTGIPIQLNWHKESEVEK
ncbi:OsmC family protein [Cerasibacillus terrae]|uniref:OsmC family protein n=1 Tax=Cerasibacillus terrae TaxID=2498845 RepID=A0A5C8P242_9BACI|nr:OsmC family protein [Cerasibacillus terrae]TXL67452.1 OsmC family protein [Cerasibacillus terrae]